MSPVLIQSLLIGILVMTAVYIGLQRAWGQNASTLKRATAVFSAACGMLTTFWLMENHTILAEYATRIVVGGIAVVLALLAIARKSSH